MSQIREVPEEVGLGTTEGLGGFCVTDQRRGRTRKWRRSWRVLCQQIREEVGLGSGEGPGWFSCRSHIVVVRHKIQTCGR